MEKLRYGIIGFGGIAENRIAKEGFGLDVLRFQGHESAELTGATDIDESRRPAAEALGLTWYSSVYDLLEDDSIDAVFIATNNTSHADVAGLSILKGKHCIVEKPMAHTVTAARELQDLARQHSISLTVDHMMTKNAFNMKARDLIKGSALGDINDITLHMEFLYGSTLQEAGTWRCANPEEIGGPLGDVGSHCLYMAEFLLDDVITEIACSLTPRTLDIQVENGAFIHFKTSRGINGSVRVAFNQPRGGLVGTLSNLGFEVYGSTGVLRSFGTLFQLSGEKNEPIKLRLELETDNGISELVPGICPNIYQQLICSHVQSIFVKAYTVVLYAILNLELLFYWLLYDVSVLLLDA